MVKLMDHYVNGRQEMDTRRIRKNGWNDRLRAFMGILPANWPYTAKVVDPRIRTSLTEKTSRLLNAKLHGQLVPREEGDMLKARINNAVLDYQWDCADKGGSMLEKIAYADTTARLYGAVFAYCYWDSLKNTNEIKIIDPRDIFIDPTAMHIRDAKWVQIREFTTIDNLKDRGFIMTDVNATAGALRSTQYEDVVKIEQGLTDRTGLDRSFPTVEVVTEWTHDKETVFLPKQKQFLKREGQTGNSRPNPYDHARIPLAQLRYSPLSDDIYGDTDVQNALSLSRAINAVLCAYIDEANISIRPPIMLVSGQYRPETIVYGPGAQWIVNSLSSAQEVEMGQGAIAHFNTTYPALVAAFNTAMGDSSLGISNTTGTFSDKTATEVNQLTNQQNSRDQYNQLYLGEFLKSIMMFWLSNNEQFMFDDPTMKYKIMKIIGKDNVQAFQQMQLDEMDIPPEAMDTIANTIMTHGGVDPSMLAQITNDVQVPSAKNSVVLNPNDDPEEYKVKPKLDVKSPDEADLYLTPGDVEGLDDYDYIPDVKSMAAGAGQMQMDARKNFFEANMNPIVLQMLQMDQTKLNIKRLLSMMGEDAGIKDAETYYEPVQAQQAGAVGAQPGTPGAGPGQQPGLPASQGIPNGQGQQALPKGAQVLSNGPAIQ